MPARRTPAKRKAAEAGHAPLSSSKAKRRPVPDGATGRAEEGKAAAAASPLATKFMAGLAHRLASDDIGQDQDTAVVEGVLRAAVSALPKGKLKAELTRDESLTVERLVAEVRAVKAKKQGAASSAADTGSGVGGVTLPAKKGQVVAEGNEGGGGDLAARQGEDVVPCTIQLYGRARRQAEEDSSSGGSGGSGIGSSSLLRSLALNPRAPLDLLVKVMGTDSDAANGGSGTAVAAGAEAALRSAVDSMRSLVQALAADPGAALSVSGVTFYAHRAADLAAAMAAALTAKAFVSRGGVSGGSGGGAARAGSGDDNAAVAVATEGLGLMLRVLQLAGLAVSSVAVSSARASNSGGGSGGTRFADPAGTLLLSCLPETTSTITAGAEEGAGAGAGGGAGGESASAQVLPPARVSVGRLLAHYTAAMTACSGGWKGGSAALVKAARLAAVVGAKRGDGNNSSSSDSSSDESDDDDEESNVGRMAGGGGESGGGGALRRHLSALCAGHLSGNEIATLEFLRCVGDAAFPQGEASASGLGSGQCRHQPTLPVASAASLAPSCARALARLPRPSASSPPTAAFFLKRAYAFRVVEALGQQAAMSGLKGITATGGRGRGGGGGGNSPGVGDGSTVRPWDFVGAAAVPVALLEFLGRPEAPLAVGGGAAGAALKELSSRRRNPAAVVELLRSSAACAPASLGPLLSAMERLGGVGGDDAGEMDSGGGGGGGGGAEGGAGEGEVGGFFVDIGDAVGGGGDGLVLAPVGNGRGVAVDTEEAERERSVSRDDMSASDEESDG